MADDDGIKYKKKRITTDVAEKTDDKKKLTRRLRWSNFHLIINTNQRFGAKEEGLTEYRDKLADCMDEVLDRKNCDKIIKFVGDDDAKFTRAFVKDFTVDFAVERSRENNTVHCHAYIRIAHYTRLQLNVDVIHKEICTKMDLDNVYIKVKVIKQGAGENMLSYLVKDVINDDDELVVDHKKEK